MKSLRESFRSNRSVASINGMPKSAIPIVDHKDERDLNVLWIEILKSEEAFRRLISEAEKYEEALKETQEIEEKLLNGLAESKIGSYYPPLREAIDEYLSVIMNTKPLVQNTTSQMHEIMVVIPSQYHSIYEHLDCLCKKRDAVLSEVDKSQEKLDRLKLKGKLTTGANVEKEKIVRQMKSINSELMTETKKFHDLRISILHQCLQASVHSRINHYGNVAKEYNDNVKICRNKNQMDDAQFNEIMNSHLKKIRDLQIVE